MEIIKEIGLQVIEILTLTFGILGMTFSAMLMFSPNLTQNLSNILNRKVNIDEKIAFLDKDIEITQYFYGHHVVVGLLLIVGSVIALSFSIFRWILPSSLIFFLIPPNKFFLVKSYLNRFFGLVKSPAWPVCFLAAY